MLEPVVVSAESEAVLSALHDHITEVHQEWKTLIELYASGDARAKLLHRAAGGFFDTVYHALLRDVLLGIARLSDPLKTGGKDNLVLERLLQLPEVVGDAALCGTVTNQFAEVKERAVPFREYRNKYLAHLDLLTSVEAREEADSVTTDDIVSMLAAIAKLFNMVDGPLRDRYVLFDKVATVGGTGHLLVALEDAEGFAELSPLERYRLRELAASKHDA
jgi:hypothetical protein